MQIAKLFERDVTRDIAPVIYFHEKSGDALQKEVSEYIITGGYADDDPRKARVERGIHEEYVRLLRGIVNEVKDFSGSEPAAWISGFYGSGKSSFAKMLGLALDDWTLPNGDSFTEAFLARNETTKREEFLNLWNELHKHIDPVSVVFDIGGSAREEPIHITMLRETLDRFEYAENDRVAIWEMKLEQDSYYDEFVSTYEEMFDESWLELGRTKRTSDAQVSAVMHAMQPKTWDNKDSWRLWFGREKPYNLAPNEVRDALVSILDKRAPGKTLFLVVDEISQYVIGQNQRMLDLQSFNSAIGNERGRIWLLATGQQKLEAQDASTELGKMKGRFPVPLRVHLGEQNIREVVHKRLLKKTPQGEQELRKLFEKNQQNLKLYAYDCAEITEEDFVEVYPLLPGHINLILDITTQIRHRSTRMQGDSHSVRGLMGLLGDLFREKELAARDMGELVRFDDIYDIQETSLDVDRQSTMQRIKTWCEQNDEPFALRVAKVVALLELIQEQQPTTDKFIAQCLYNRVDRGPTLLEEVKRALNTLKSAEPVPLISYSEKRGYRLESSARAEWNRERDEISISSDDQVAAIQKQLKELLSVPSDPKISGVSLPLEATYTDSRGAIDVVLKGGRSQAVAPVSMQLLNKDDRSGATWLRKSSEDSFKNKLVWVTGDIDHVFDAARRWARSYKMVQRKERVRESLALENQQLLIQEKTEEETRLKQLRESVARTFMDGTFYFRGREISPRDKGDGFGSALEHAATGILEELYPHFFTLQVTSSELDQLFQPSLDGASQKFMAGHDGLGILELDAGQITATCKGQIPQQILRLVREMEGLSGSIIFDRFGSIPYGYSSSAIKTCLLGLLRGRHIKIVQKGGAEYESHADPGAKDLFSGERDLKHASFYLGGDIVVDPRMRVACCKLLEPEFEISVEREDQPIAEAVFKNFPTRNGQLSTLRNRLLSLPVNVSIPSALKKLEDAISATMASRDIVKTVLATYNNIDDLRNGFQQLKLIDAELTDQTVATLGKIRRVMDIEYAQMSAIEETTREVEEAHGELKTQVELDRPWTNVASLEPHIETIREAYRKLRRNELERLSQEVEDARLVIKSRDGFEKLDADQSNAVLRPLALVVPDTDAESTHPPLSLLRARRGTGLAEALNEAHAELDDIQEVVVVVQHKLSGKIIKSQSDLDAALEELRKVISERLKQGKEVRLQ